MRFNGNDQAGEVSRWGEPAPKAAIARWHTVSPVSAYYALFRRFGSGMLLAVIAAAAGGMVGEI